MLCTKISLETFSLSCRCKLKAMLVGVQNESQGLLPRAWAVRKPAFFLRTFAEKRRLQANDLQAALVKK